MSSLAPRSSARISAQGTGGARPASQRSPPKTESKNKKRATVSTKKSAPMARAPAAAPSADAESSQEGAAPPARCDNGAPGGAAPTATAPHADDQETTETDNTTRLQEPPRAEARTLATALEIANEKRKRPVVPPAVSTALPRYDGARGGPLKAWLREVERITDMNGLDDDQQALLMRNRLEGAADQWWTALPKERRVDLSADKDAFIAALTERFTTATSASQAMEELINLKQGGRHVDEYVAEFQRLTTLLPELNPAMVRHFFHRGLSAELAQEVDRQPASTPLPQLIALVTRIGAMYAAVRRDRPAASARQMDLGDALPGWSDSIERAVAKHMELYAMQESFAARKRAFRAGGASIPTRAARFRAPTNEPLPLPKVPGVPPELVQKRRDARLCYRCGSKEHARHDCPNAVNAHPVPMSSN